MTFVRLLINDGQNGLQGQELSDDSPYTPWIINLAYSNLQDDLEDTNVESVTTAEAIVGPLSAAPSAASDPNTQIRLGYNGYWDGTNDTDGEVTLPGDLVMPLRVWSRPAGSVQPFLPVKQQFGGIEARFGMGLPNLIGNGSVWEFRGNALYMPGNIQAMDLRIRYIPSLALFPSADIDFTVQVPLARAAVALAYGIAAEWTEIRGALNAPMLRAKYEKRIEVISNKTAKRENASITRSRGYGFGRRRRGW